MIGWLIIGALVFFVLRNKSTVVPQPGGAVVMKPAYTPVAALPHSPVAQSFGGNEPVMPGSPAPIFISSAAIQKTVDAQVVKDISANLQIAVNIDKAQGSYIGYGVPLSGPGMFAPLESTSEGTFIIDSGSGFTLGGGPLMG